MEQATPALRDQGPAFREARRSASFTTLMRVDQVRRIRPLAHPKRDRRGWVVLGSVAGKG